MALRIGMVLSFFMGCEISFMMRASQEFISK